MTKEKFMGRGKNGNVLMGRCAHPVRCYDENNMPIKTFKSMNQAAEWLVHNNFAKSINSAKVSITHAINGRQHYWGKDFICKSAYGMIWKSIR